MFTGIITGAGRLAAREARDGDVRLTVDVGSLPFDPFRRRIELADQRAEPIVGLRRPIRVEGVRADHIGTGFQESAVDCGNVQPLGDRQQVVFALVRLRPIGKALAAKVPLIEMQGLDARAHRAVQNRDAGGEESLELRARVTHARRPREARSGARGRQRA